MIHPGAPLTLDAPAHVIVKIVYVGYIQLDWCLGALRKELFNVYLGLPFSHLVTLL